MRKLLLVCLLIILGYFATRTDAIDQAIEERPGVLKADEAGKPQGEAPPVFRAGDLPTPAAERERWPRSPDELQVSLSVVQALEEGPVICKVNLKNVSAVPLDYATSMFDKGAYCGLDSRGKVRMEPPIRCELICGSSGPYTHTLKPSETASETFYFHKSFLSIPPGKAKARFGWRVYRVVKERGKDVWGERALDLLFELKGTQEVDILPATKKNLAPVRAGLETEFARVAKRTAGTSDYIWTNLDPAEEFVSTMDGCRHKEFVPLLMRAIDRLPASQFRQQLVATIYESFATPEEAFSARADYLSTPHPAAAVEVLDYWLEEHRAHEKSKSRQEKLRQPLPRESDPEKGERQTFWREFQQREEVAWKNSKRHLDTRLTKEQFGRLRALSDVWIRALLYAHFPDQCPAEWVKRLHEDLKQVVRPPERFRELLARLDDDRFAVREQATAQLIESGPAFAWHLWAVPQAKLSAEAAQRLQAVLQRVKKPELPRLWQRTLFHLATDRQPHHQKLLDLLRVSDCPSLISLAAQEAFERYNKNR